MLILCKKNYIFQLSKGQAGEVENLTEDTFGKMLQDQRQKNGFAFVSIDFDGMNGVFFKMNTKCKELISQINNELNK